MKLSLVRLLQQVGSSRQGKGAAGQGTWRLQPEVHSCLSVPVPTKTDAFQILPKKVPKCFHGDTAATMADLILVDRVEAYISLSSQNHLP
ncbi:unnamed protein product [Victoria cruziana]